MKSIASLRGEIINRLWNNGTNDPKRDPAFHKWLEQTLYNHSVDIITECIRVSDEASYISDTGEEINKLKKKLT